MMTVNSRRNEFAADAFAHGLGMGADLATGLIKISVGKLLLSFLTGFHQYESKIIQHLNILLTFRKPRQYGTRQMVLHLPLLSSTARGTTEGDRAS